eukprot:752267-Hanusia_phi.AAC.2
MVIELAATKTMKMVVIMVMMMVTVNESSHVGITRPITIRLRGGGPMDDEFLPVEDWQIGGSESELELRDSDEDARNAYRIFNNGQDYQEQVKTLSSRAVQTIRDFLTFPFDEKSMEFIEKRLTIRGLLEIVNGKVGAQISPAFSHLKAVRCMEKIVRSFEDSRGLESFFARYSISLDDLAATFKNALKTVNYPGAYYVLNCLTRLADEHAQHLLVEHDILVDVLQGLWNKESDTIVKVFDIMVKYFSSDLGLATIKSGSCLTLLQKALADESAQVRMRALDLLLRTVNISDKALAAFRDLDLQSMLIENFNHPDDVVVLNAIELAWFCPIESLPLEAIYMFLDDAILAWEKRKASEDTIPYVSLLHEERLKAVARNWALQDGSIPPFMVNQLELHMTDLMNRQETGPVALAVTACAVLCSTKRGVKLFEDMQISVEITQSLSQYISSTREDLFLVALILMENLILHASLESQLESAFTSTDNNVKRLRKQGFQVSFPPFSLSGFLCRLDDFLAGSSVLVDRLDSDRTEAIVLSRKRASLQRNTRVLMYAQVPFHEQRIATLSLMEKLARTPTGADILLQDSQMVDLLFAHNKIGFVNENEAEAIESKHKLAKVMLKVRRRVTGGNFDSRASCSIQTSSRVTAVKRWCIP